jgi:transcriptional regulator with XRE-family HTH domain
VSLPTIQNIEAGRANPELETIQKLLHVLGIETQWTARKVDWDFLSTCGVPLLGSQPSRKPELRSPFSRTRFIEEMRLALL